MAVCLSHMSPMQIERTFSNAKKRFFLTVYLVFQWIKLFIWIDLNIIGYMDVAELKIFKSLTVILFAYLVLWTPYYIYIDMECFCPNLVSNYFNQITSTLNYLNSGINPFIYAFSTVEIRNTLRNTVHMDIHKNVLDLSTKGSLQSLAVTKSLCLINFTCVL